VEPQLKEEQQQVTNGIKRIGMGVPEVGTEVTGAELVTILGNIGDKGGEATAIQEQVKDSDYRVEEVNVKELYDKDQPFRDYVDNYDRKEKNTDGLLVPAIMDVRNQILDGRSRLAQQYINGETTAQVFKELKQPVVENNQQPQEEVVENIPQPEEKPIVDNTELNADEKIEIQEQGGNEIDFISSRTVFSKPFDDKNLPNVESPLVKEFINNEVNGVVQSVDIKDLTPTQRVLDKNISEASQSEGNPFVIKDKSGRLLVVDGHHRIASESVKGNTQVKVDIFDISRILFTIS